MALRPWRRLLIAIAIVAAIDATVLFLVLNKALHMNAQMQATGGAVSPLTCLRFSQGPEVASLDPAKITALADGRVAAALFEGLTVINPGTQTARPGVARSWTRSADGLTYTFFLRDDARWSDGTPVTAEDFAYSWRRVLDVRTEAQYNYMLFPIRGAEEYVQATVSRETARGEAKTAKGTDAEAQVAGKLVRAEEAVRAAEEALGIRVVNDRTLEVTLTRPTSYFLELVAFTTYLPVNRRCVESAGGDRTDTVEQWAFPDRIVCNGAYVLAHHEFKSLMRLTVNPHYWNREKVRLQTIDIMPIEAAETCFIAYERGELDFITVVPPLAGERLLEQHRRGERDDFVVMPNLGTYYYRFNVTRPPLDDVRVRMALCLAVNKDEVVAKGGRLGQPVASVLVPPGLPGYHGPAGLSHDPVRARQLLADAGYPGGKGFPRLSLLYNTLEAHKAIAEIVYESWRRELGIEVELTNVEAKVWLDRCAKLDYDISRAGWYGDYVDPNTFLDMFLTGGGNNNTGWSNAEYDRLIHQAAEALDPARRMQFFQRAETILVENEVPILPLYHYVGTMLVRSHVKGWQPNLRNDILFQDLWIEREPEDAP
jgi:oligopeptide transport system substrate-binding protein